MGVAHEFPERRHLLVRPFAEDGEGDATRLEVGRVLEVPDGGGAALALIFERLPEVPQCLKTTIWSRPAKTSSSGVGPFFPTSGIGATSVIDQVEHRLPALHRSIFDTNVWQRTHQVRVEEVLDGVPHKLRHPVMLADRR